MNNKQSIFIRKGKKLGKTLAVFAGVHGNEKVGVRAMNILLKQVNIEYGKVYFVYANPKAIKLGVRKIASDLNRSCLPKNTGNNYEERRAKVLMKILDECDALLDLHAFRYKEGYPFIICEKDSYDLASKMDFKFITSGWDKFDIGSTDGYMRSMGKDALCLELGSTTKEQEYLPLAIKSINQFLKYYGAIQDNVMFSNRKQKYLKLKNRIFKKTNEFKFSKKYKTCDHLKQSAAYALDDKKVYTAKIGEYVLFPDDSGPIGDEVCLIAKEISPNK
jgi:succinylglutamate desuccinylase